MLTGASLKSSERRPRAYSSGALTPTALLFSMVSIVILQLVGNTLALDSQRREQDLAQETVHLQRWQFSQLVKR